MSSKTIAMTGILASLTIVLNYGPFKVPAFYAPFLYYQLWEIPIVMAYLLLGFFLGMSTALINTISLLLIFPGALQTGPFYNLIAIFGMLFGMHLARYVTSSNNNPKKNFRIIFFSTILGMIVRIALMTTVNYLFLRYPPPLGFGISEQVILTMIPVIAFFNATIVLYTIPVGYFFVRIIRYNISGITK